MRRFRFDTRDLKVYSWVLRGRCEWACKGCYARCARDVVQLTSMRVMCTCGSQKWIQTNKIHSICPPFAEFDEFFSSTIMLAFAASGQIILVSVLSQSPMLMSHKCIKHAVSNLLVNEPNLNIYFDTEVCYYVRLIQSISDRYMYHHLSLNTLYHHRYIWCLPECCAFGNLRELTTGNTCNVFIYQLSWLFIESYDR